MRSLLLALGLSLLSSACNGYGDGSGEVRGAIRVPRCTVAGPGVAVEGSFPTYDLQPTFFTVERRQNVVTIQMRRDTRDQSRTDSLDIDLRDVTKLVVGVPVEVRPDLEPNAGVASPVRLGLSMLATCARFDSGLLGRGTITFNTLDLRDGGLIDATFTVDLLDSQALRETGSDSVLGSLFGRFRIPLHLAPEPG